MGPSARSLKGEFSLLATAIIWGSGFVAVDAALNCGFPPAMINAIRFTFGALLLLMIVNKKVKAVRRDDLKTGVVAGLFFFLGFYLQTIGLQYTTVSTNALLTATNILMVPFILWFIFKRKPENKVFGTIFLCFIGILVLTWNSEGGGFQFGRGEVFVLLSAAAYACHISYLGVKSGERNPTIFTFLQLATVAILSIITFLATEVYRLEAIVWFPGVFWLLYLSIFPTALCLFLQTYGQKHTATGKSAIILSLESLFGSLFSVLLGLEPITASLIIGGVIILTSVILAEWTGTSLKTAKS